jgi:hypothetical protein
MLRSKFRSGCFAANAAAAERGIPLRALVSEALEDKLRSDSLQGKPWMEAFGKLRSLHAENRKLDRLIEREFGRIEPQ